EVGLAFQVKRVGTLLLLFFGQRIDPAAKYHTRDRNAFCWRTGHLEKSMHNRCLAGCRIPGDTIQGIFAGLEHYEPAVYLRLFLHIINLGERTSNSELLSEFSDDLAGAILDQCQKNELRRKSLRLFIDAGLQG